MRDLIHYKNSFSLHCFNLINDPNSEYFYSTIINSWKKQRLNELQKNKNLNARISLLKPFLIDLRDLMLKIVELYSCMNQNSASFKITHYEQNILNLLEHIGSFDISIRLNSAEGNYDLAYKLKEYCVLMFDDCISTIKNDLCIDIYKSPLKEDFSNAKIKISGAAESNKVELLLDKSGKKKKPETKKKNLEDYIRNINKKNAFLIDLKKTFKTEKGIKFRILIELLKDEKVLLIGSREFQNFYNCISVYFNRNIGTYQALNDSYKHSDEDISFRKDEIAEISQKLNPLIIKHKTN